MTVRTDNTLNVPEQDVIYSQEPSAENVVAMFKLATGAEIIHGMNWYRDAHDIAGRIAKGDYAMGAGVLAAMSPMMGWDRNVEVAENAFRDGKASGGLKRNCEKSDKIMSGDNPLDVLGGDKVRNFYLAILDPENSIGVVVDRHAFDIAVGEVTNDKTRGALSRKGIYEKFSQAYIIAAEIVSLELGFKVSGCQMQAITWVAWRRLKGIK